MYEKDVFERLSLRLVNLANSNHRSRQMTTETSAWCASIFIIYGSYWRGLIALSILCDEGNARAYEFRMGKRNRHLRLFCIVSFPKNIFKLLSLWCCEADVYFSMSKLFILGNGFDIKHGIPSRYSDFAKFVQGVNIELFQYVERVVQNLSPNGLWSNFEEALATQNVEELLKHKQEENDVRYNDLQMAFRDWVISVKKYIDFANIGKKYQFDENDKFLTFNYTNTLEKVYGINSSNICHIHGYMENKESEELFTDYIWGHGREKEELDITIEDEYSRQEIQVIIVSYKKKHQMQKMNDFLNEKIGTIEGETDFVVLGHSLGLVDKPYFKTLFEKYPTAKWRIGYFEDSDYIRKRYSCHEIGIKEPLFFQDK